MRETDLELLARYVRLHAEDAFAEIVRRHLALVHSAALRQIHSPDLAEEVAQSAFLKLARHAADLPPDTVVTAWLYQVTRREAIDVLRRESRRQLREHLATEMNTMNATADDWAHIEPLLDDAMQALDETDRAAVLLRYFEKKSLREVGHALGMSDDAAQKRVSRAVERLREFFAKRGATVGASGLVVAISANAVQAVPAGLAATICSAASLAGTAFATTTTTVAKTMAMTTLQKALVSTILVAAIGAGIFEARQASSARAQVQALENRQTSQAEQVQQLIDERDDATRRLASLREDNARLIRNALELPKLRDQMGILRKQISEINRQLAECVSGTNGLAGNWPLGSVKWLPEWKDAGLGSPEAAAETYWWALATENSTRARQCMVNRLPDGPVSELFAKREVRAEGYPLKSGRIGGIRLYSLSQSRNANSLPSINEAKIEVEKMLRVRVEDGLPAAPNGRPSWMGGDRTTLELKQVGEEWKIVVDENRVRLSPDDDDAEAVAEMMIKMKPEMLEKLKADPRLPLRTLRAYEEMKAKAAK